MKKIIIPTLCTTLTYFGIGLSLAVGATSVNATFTATIPIQNSIAITAGSSNNEMTTGSGSSFSGTNAAHLSISDNSAAGYKVKACGTHGVFKEPTGNQFDYRIQFNGYTTDGGDAIPQTAVLDLGPSCTLIYDVPSPKGITNVSNVYFHLSFLTYSPSNFPAAVYSEKITLVIESY